MVKIFLDDCRKCPSGYILARNWEEFFDLFYEFKDRLIEVSLDHDLGEYDNQGNEVTGYHVLCKIEELFGGKHPDFNIYVHSSNPNGVEKMVVTIRAMGFRAGVNILNPQKHYPQSFAFLNDEIKEI